jgi:hypothetical protein
MDPNSVGVGVEKVQLHEHDLAIFMKTKSWLANPLILPRTRNRTDLLVTW